MQKRTIAAGAVVWGVAVAAVLFAWHTPDPLLGGSDNADAKVGHSIREAVGDRTPNTLDRTAFAAGPIQAKLAVPGSQYNFSVREDTTAYEAMEQLADHTEFAFDGTHYPGIGFFVEEINGLRQNPGKGKYWIYSINNKKASVGVSQYTIQQNDIITWTYEHKE